MSSPDVLNLACSGNAKRSRSSPGLCVLLDGIDRVVGCKHISVHFEAELGWHREEVCHDVCVCVCVRIVCRRCSVQSDVFRGCIWTCLISDEVGLRAWFSRGRILQPLRSCAGRWCDASLGFVDGCTK